MPEPDFPVIPVVLRRTDGPPHVCDLPTPPQSFVTVPQFVMCTRPTCRRVYERRPFVQHHPSPSGGFWEQQQHRWEECGPIRSAWMRWRHNRATSVGAPW